MTRKEPRFILSYARQDRDNYLERFYSDLRKEIAFREALSTEPNDSEAGFRDVNDIPSATA